MGKKGGSFEFQFGTFLEVRLDALVRHNVAIIVQSGKKGPGMPAVSRPDGNNLPE
jgi:hypothetical protein